MIVYVESNFILEIAREQEEASFARKILDFAESGGIELAFPSFSLSETFSTIKRQQEERNSLYNSLVETLKQLQRSEPHKRIMLDLESVLVVLNDAVNKEFGPLHSTVERMLSIGRSLETNVSSFRQAIVYQGQLSLRKQQDSVIFSTIIADLERRLPDETKCFLSRDKDFADNPRIKSKLKPYRCSYLPSFKDGLYSIQNTLQKTE